MSYAKNVEYIELLQKHYKLQKITNDSPAIRVMKQRLIEIERVLTSQEILFNTKNAFPLKTHKENENTNIRCNEEPRNA